MKLCQLCKTSPATVKAHIIPQWCYKEMLRDGHALHLSLDPATYRTRSQKGVYDSDLVCARCETSYFKYDKHAASFFRDMNWKKDSFVYRESDELYLKQICEPDYDYHKLKMFCLTLLWRASATSQTLFQHFDLGPRQDILRRHILKDDPSDIAFFAIFIHRFFKSSALPGIDPTEYIQGPQTGRIGGYWRAILSLYAFKMHIHTDSRPPTRFPTTHLLQPGCFFVTGSDFGTGIELYNLNKIAIAEYQRNQNKTK